MKILGALAGPSGDQLRQAVGGVPRRHGLAHDWTAGAPSTALAAERSHHNRHASVGLHAAVEPHVVQVRPLRAAVTPRAVHALRGRGLVTVSAAINVEARAIKRGAGGGKTEASRGGRCNQTVECRDAMGLERLQGPCQRLSMEVLGCDAGRQAPRGWVRLEKVRDTVAWLGDQAKPVEPPGVARRPRGDETHGRVLVGRLVHAVANAELVKQRGHASPMIEDVTPAAVSPRVLRSGGASPALPT